MIFFLLKKGEGGGGEQIDLSTDNDINKTQNMILLSQNNDCK